MQLVIVDASARRHTERRAYNRVAEALEKQARRRRRFEDDDKPAFERWIETEFELELTALREEARRAYELRRLIADVRRYATLAKTSERRAYELLLAARREGREDDLWDEVSNRMSDADRDEAYRRHEPSEDGDGHGPSRSGPDPDDDPSDRPSRRGALSEHLKTLYRQLVRALHPDLRAGDDASGDRLWHEVQAAYEWADVQTMERLYRAIIKNAPVAKPGLSLEERPIGEIIALREDMERRLAELERAVEDCKRHPAWDFAATRRNERRRRRLAAMVGDELTEDIGRTRREADGLAKIVARWTRR